MNKWIIGILFLWGTINIATAQSWEDSLQMGKKYYQKGNYEKSYQTLINAQKIAPEKINLSKDIGNAAYKAHHYKVAKNAFQNALSQSVGNKVEQANFWHNIGNCDMKSKDYESAIASYKKALRENPSNDKTRYNLAVAQQKIRQNKQQQQNKNQNKDQDKDQDKKQQKNNNPSKKNQSGDTQQKKQNKNQEKQGSAGNQQKNNNSGKKKNGTFANMESDRILKDLQKEGAKTRQKVHKISSEDDPNTTKSTKQW